MRAIVFWPVLGVLLIAVVGIVIASKPRAVIGWVRRGRHGRLIERQRERFTHQREHLIAGLGAGWAYLLLISASIPPIVVVCLGAGKLASHQPFWTRNVSIYHWFAHEGPKVPLLLDVLRLVTRLGEPIIMLIVCTAACVGLVLMAKERRWLGPALVAFAFVVERYVQKAIGVLVNQPHPPTAGSGFPSGGVTRVLAVYGFIAYLYLRLGKRHSWSFVVNVWTLIAIFAFLMGCARAILLLHWPFDIPGGWLFGVLLLFTNMAACTLYDGSFFPTRTKGSSIGGSAPEAAASASGLLAASFEQPRTGEES